MQLVRARVSFAAREEYRLILPEAPEEIAAEPSGRLRTYDELPAVGDWVQVRLVGNFALIEAVEPRHTCFQRPKGGGWQVLAANIDTAFLVAGLDGDFNPRRLERYFLMARESGARPVFVLNKADVGNADAARDVLAPMGAPIVTLTATENADPLWAYMDEGLTVALFGSSGVGKSTIANALLGGDRLATGAVRVHDSRGRHTTTGRMLMALPGGAWLIDTPGLRELAVAGDGAGEAFPEIVTLADGCRFRDCSHAGEPGCAVRAAVESGAVSAERWASFQKLEAEMRYARRESDVHLKLAEKKKWKAIHKAMRDRPS